MATGYDQPLLRQIVQGRIDELENTDERLYQLHHDIFLMTKQKFEQAGNTDQLHDASRGVDRALVFLISLIQNTKDWLSQHGGESLEPSTQGGDQNPVEKPSATGYDQLLLRQLLQVRIDKLENTDDILCRLHHEIVTMTKQQFADARQTRQLEDTARDIDRALVFLISLIQQTKDWLRQHGGDEYTVEEPSEQLVSTSLTEPKITYLAGKTSCDERGRTFIMEELKRITAFVEERVTRLEVQRSSGDIESDLNELEDLKKSLEEKERLMTEKIDRIHEKLSYLEMTKVHPLDERVIALESSSLKNEENSDFFGSRFFDLEKKQQYCDERFEIMETDKQKVETRFEELESDRQKTNVVINNRMVKLETETMTKLGEMEDYGKKAKELFGKIEIGMEKTGDIFMKIKSDRQRTEDRFAKIDNFGQKVKERFDKLEDKEKETNKIFEEIKNNVLKVEKINQDTQRQLQNLDTKKNQLQNELNGMKRTTEDIQKKEVETKSMIEALVYPPSTMVLPVLNEAECKKSEEQCINRHLHAQFVDGQNFQVENLPEPYRDLELRDCVVRLAQLSCLIQVNDISQNRPLVFPNTNKPYPFGGRGGEAKVVRLGSGWVIGVFRHNSPCTCPVCKKPGTAPAGQHGVIRVFTATHLVFDQSESKLTTIQLNLGGDTFTLTDGKWFEVGGGPAVSLDWCLVCFATHDMELVDRLKDLVKNSKQDYDKMNRKYDKGQVFGGLAVMISHPHGVGRAKVTVGCTKHWSHKLIGGKDCYHLCTTMASCVGCSGALVWPVGLMIPDGRCLALGIPHSERTPDGSQTTGSFFNKV